MRPAGELLEHARQHRLDRGEHVVLGDEAHLEVELVEFAWRAVGARVLVAKAGRDLEIAVEARDHDQLLEHLRRLRERVELARMDPARNEIIARALGRAGGQDRRLELGEALIDHPPADRGDHRRAQHDVGVDLLAAKIEVAVLEPDLFGIVLLAGDRHRQLGRGRLDLDLAARTSISPVGEVGIHRLGARATTAPLTVTTDSTRSRSSSLERRASVSRDDLGYSVMIAQVDEQHCAVVALTVDPARQADRLANVGGAQLGATMGAIGVHAGFGARLGHYAVEIARRASMGRSFLSTRGARRYWP